MAGSDPRDSDARVDDLRRQLRALGYLDAGVDRFVLGPARAARSPATIAVLAALRVGVIAALLLGPAVAAGMSGRLPGLVTGPRDAAVIAIYLGVMFGVAASLFSFVTSMAVASLARRLPAIDARWLSRVAGGLVAVASLAYLTLWWRSANAGISWDSPLWTTVALTVAVTITLLLGHAVAITTFAVMAARGPVGGASLPASPSTWRLVVFASIAAFVGAAALLTIGAPAQPDAAAPPLAVVSAGLKVKVIAIDGFDPEVFDGLRADRRVPALARLVDSGRVRIAVDPTRDPARAWTTVATGQLPDVHGVRSLETRRVAGVEGTVASGEERGVMRGIRAATDLLRLTRPSVASGSELRAKPFWEVAADAGLRAVVVNWWATWPAPADGANTPIVLSDRAALRLERGGALDAEIAPKALYERLRSEWGDITSQAATSAATLLPQASDSGVAAVLKRSAELDALQLELALRAHRDPSDLLAIYLPGLDIAQHTLLGTSQGAGQAAISARLNALRGYYAYLDGLLGPMLAPSSGEVLVLLTQPGRLSSTAPGLVALSGPGMAAGITIDAAAVDVAPTVLHALGVPASTELAGRVLTPLFSKEFLARFPVRQVATYGRRSRQSLTREGQPLDAEMIERLRSLGYVR